MIGGDDVDVTGVTADGDESPSCAAAAGRSERATLPVRFQERCRSG